MGDEFSKKQLERYRKDSSNTTLKCKKCVAAAEQMERDKAAARRKESNVANNAQDGDGEVDDETRMCCKCNNKLPKSAYNKNQWYKGESKSKCRECVEASLKEEAKQQTASKEDKIARARRKVEDAKKLQGTSNNSVHMLAVAESELAALEAEMVTGLKPVKLSSARRGGRRGRGGRRA